MASRTGPMIRQWRTAAIFVAVAICVASLLGAIAEQRRAWRLAANPVAIATVRSAWFEHQKKGGPDLFAHLVFDRKRPDGQTVHCDVPAVNVTESGRKLSPGDTIRIVPMPDECWEPDVICETCEPVTQQHIAMMYVASAISGLLLTLLVWQAVRDLQRNNTANSQLPDLPKH